MHMLTSDHKQFTSKIAPWDSEAGFVDFIEQNIYRFTSDCLGESYSSHYREWYLGRQKGFAANLPRIDLMIDTGNSRIGVECKHPKQPFSELSRSISQLLSYSVLSDRNGHPLDRLVLATTQYDDVLTEMIIKFKIPVDIVVIGRHARLEWFGGYNG